VDWTEAYRPQTLADVIGNGPSVKKLRDWAQQWVGGAPETKAVILAGPPGTGKTSAALALARDMGWQAIELNASDARNAERIRRVATAGAMHQTFGADGAFHQHTDAEAGRKLIILDEADNLYERMSGESAAGGKAGIGGTDLGDRGGKAQIIATIRETKQPIVLIVNELYELQKGSGAALRSLAETMKWQRVNVRSIPRALANIAKAEGIVVDPAVLDAIAQNASGDLRAAVRDLQSLCAGRTHVTLQHLESTGYRDNTGTVFDAVRHILKGTRLRDLRREINVLDVTPADLVLWVDENLGKEYQHPEDLMRGYEMLAKADRFLGRAQRTQNYRLWAYASDLSTAGVMTARQHEYRKFVPFGFPQWLSKMSRSRGARQLKDSLAVALGRATHQSKRKSRNDQVGVFEALFRTDGEFAAAQTARLALSDEQVGLLLDEKPTAKRVQTIRAAADAHAAREPRARPTRGLDAHAGEADDETLHDSEDAAGTGDADKAGDASDDRDEDATNDGDEGDGTETPGRGQQTLF
jgi:replication factor C large subunit